MKRTVLITGGTGSVGQALVSRFAAAGYSVVFQYHSNKKAAKSLAATADVRTISIDFRRNTVPRLGNIDILINNAAINTSRSNSGDVTGQEWDEHLRINLTWPFILIKKCLPNMIRNKWGRIINISSIYGLRACEGNLPYNVSKHGLSALTKTVAKEYGQFGISTNEICPGPIQSELLHRIARYHAKEDGVSIKQYYSSLEEEIPSGRFASPKDVAATALFLASDDASYLNGVSLPVDGGLIA